MYYSKKKKLNKKVTDSESKSQQEDKTDEHHCKKIAVHDGRKLSAGQPTIGNNRKSAACKQGMTPANCKTNRAILPATRTPACPETRTEARSSQRRNCQTSCITKGHNATNGKQPFKYSCMCESVCVEVSNYKAASYRDDLANCNAALFSVNRQSTNYEMLQVGRSRKQAL